MKTARRETEVNLAAATGDFPARRLAGRNSIFRDFFDVDVAQSACASIQPIPRERDEQGRGVNVFVSLLS